MRPSARGTSLVVVSALVGSAVACGSPPPPKNGAQGDEASAPTSSTGTPTAKADVKAKPKVESKYPEPFMEPDCAVPQAEGYLPDAKKVVAEVRKAHWKQLEACAEAAPAGENVHGEIRTQFRLDPDGVPRCVEAPGSSVSQVDVVRCVISVYRTFRFPKPKNGSVRVTDGIQLDVSHEDE